ncbi:MAG TPA: DUF1707 domain-containing protein [Solirubrobacteraceae bacterium]|nr:DUF1707 domain-containing protein [Solirubrobacteraceae bacterium]
MSEERTPGAGVRASDEDRERLVAELNEHAVAGRLSTDDLEQRVQAAYQATTTGQLAALRRDLPVSARQTQLDHVARRSHLTRRMIQESGGSLGLFVVCSGIWLASGATGQFWPVLVLVVFLITLVRNGWALYGPAPDLDAVERHLDARRKQRHDHHDHHRHVERRSDSRRTRDD